LCITLIATIIIASITHSPASAKMPACRPSDVLAKLFREKIDRKLGTADDWKLPAELQKTLAKYWEDSSDPLEMKMRHTYEKVLEARVAGMSRFSRVMVKLAAKNVLERKGWYQRSLGSFLGFFGGSHYNPVFNSVFLSSRSGSVLSDYVVAFHEMQHAMDRNTNLMTMFGLFAKSKEVFSLVPTPFSAMSLYNLETKAIGSQWELFQMIPFHQRLKIRDAIIRENKIYQMTAKSDEKWLKEWIEKRRKKRVPFSEDDLSIIEGLMSKMKHVEHDLDMSEEIAVKSINYSIFDKDQFITIMRDTHGYTYENILKHHYRIGAVRIILMGVTVMNAPQIVDAIEKNDPKKMDEKIKLIPLRDIQLYTRIISSVMLESEEEKTKYNDNKALKELEEDMDE
jgi:hypothetical protein